VNALEHLIREHFEGGAAIAAAVAVLQGGRIVHLGGYGVTNLEGGGVQVTPKTLFAFGSISKNLCAALIMRLVERDLLDLDLPVVQYLRDFRFSHADFWPRVTLRHVLSHTSGLPSAGKNWGPRDPDALRRFVYEQVPLYTILTEPGQVHLYSNTVYCVAGHVTEAVTGRYYDELVQELVLDPLQKVRTTFDPVVAMTYPIALPHERGPDGQVRVVHRMPDNPSGNPSSFALGSVSDLANLAQMYLNQGSFGELPFLSPSSVAEMQKWHASRHVSGAAHPLAHVNAGFGLGFALGHYRGRPVARHGGMNPGYNCFFDLFPNEGAGVALLATYLPEQEEALIAWVVALYDLALDLPHRGIVFLDKPEALAVMPAESESRRYEGTYLNVETADLVTVALTDDGLIMDRQGGVWPLVPIGQTEFYVEHSERYRVPVAFLAGSNGKVTHVMVGGQPYHPVELDPAIQPDPNLWASYEGLYRDPSNCNPEDMLAVHLRDGVLHVAEGDHRVGCRAISNRCFLSELGLIEFEEVGSARVQVLVWGKATRFYPLDERAFTTEKVVRFKVDVPANEL
jgi:CubicO group peptidase (beta-lactamase class C family)